MIKLSDRGCDISCSTIGTTEELLYFLNNVLTSRLFSSSYTLRDPTSDAIELVVILFLRVYSIYLQHKGVLLFGASSLLSMMAFLVYVRIHPWFLAVFHETNKSIENPSKYPDGIRNRLLGQY